jgi:alkylation response protein AidB-like acyl-CoA dehydrogenase
MLDLNRPDDAQVLLSEAKLVADEIEDRRGQVLSGLWLGLLQLEQNEIEGAARVDRARRLAHEIGYYRAESLGLAISEMVGQANWSWGMYPGLSHGCMNTLETHGTDEQKHTYLPKLVSGEWTGTMCLTEPHCGTDLGMLRTKAEPQADGTYKVSGTKIFISSGEHDMSENIIHIVLARLPDAPAGTKGISLFIVPKFLVNADGEKGERNTVSCGSLEHKMGIHGNATCVMNFDGATGYLIGEPNKGLNAMFTFMNTARLGTALQGLAHSEIAFQGGIQYARERLQMRSLTGNKAPEKPADPIIVHPDVRRMLLTMKAFTEGNRAMVYFTAKQVDILKNSQERIQISVTLTKTRSPMAVKLSKEGTRPCHSQRQEVTFRTFRDTPTEPLTSETAASLTGQRPASSTEGCEFLSCNLLGPLFFLQEFQ